MNLSKKLTLLVLLIIIPIVVGISFLVYLSTARIVEDRIKAQLVDHASHLMDKLDRVLYNKYLDMKFLAADPVLRARGSSPALIKGRLDEFVSVHKTYSSASFFTMDRVRVADTSGREVGKRHSLSRYWPEIEEGREFTARFSPSSESLNTEVMHFAHVVRGAGGAPVGVVVARMPMEELAAIFESAHTGLPSEEVDLVDADGRILYANAPSHGENGRFREWESFRGETAMGPDAGAFLHHSPGEDEEVYVYARERGFKDFKGIGLTLIMDFPRATTFAEVVRLRSALFIILVVAGIAILVTVYLMTSRITAPLSMLATASEAVARGNLNAEVGPVYPSGDEVGRLVVSYDAMLKGLRDYRDRLLIFSAEVEDARRKLEEAERIGRLGNWEWNVASGAVKFSDEAERIFRACGAEVGTYDAFLAAIHPEDREAVRAAVEEALASGRYSAEYRLTCGAGGARHLRARAEVSFGLSGKPVRMLGTVQDVTDEKEREENLKRLNAELTEAMANVKLLSGMLPICSSCKKIRDDSGYWNSVEKYLTEHSGVEFTHGICPECAKRLYGSFYKDK